LSTRMQAQSAPESSVQSASETMPAWQAAAGGNMSFEVALVRPGEPSKFSPPNLALNIDDSLTPRVAIEHTVPVEMEPLTQSLDRLADRQRFETTLLGFFALTGLGLAVVGLYGLIFYDNATDARDRCTHGPRRHKSQYPGLDRE
ncbi:MAG TPA: hypothetical protein VGR71_00590, partial [Nitrospira sp.]|nr:hypothetical protein [Nitrospira sp.]